jgi:hypothetical protein
MDVQQPLLFTEILSCASCASCSSVSICRKLRVSMVCTQLFRVRSMVNSHRGCGHVEKRCQLLRPRTPERR